PSGKRSYVVDYYANGTRRRMSIGLHGKITCEEARKLAIGILGSVVKGADAAAERAAHRKALTVSQLCKDYMQAAAKGLVLNKHRLPKKASTLAVDAGRIARHIVPLLGKRHVVS